MNYIAPDGHEISVCWEYGIKMAHDGTFIHLGDMALPVECLEDLNDPELYLLVQQAATEMILEHLIITIRPLAEEEYPDENISIW